MQVKEESFVVQRPTHIAYCRNISQIGKLQDAFWLQLEERIGKLSQI